MGIREGWQEGPTCRAGLAAIEGVECPTAVGMRGVAGLFANGGMGQAVGQQIQPKPMGRGLNFPALGAHSSNAPGAAGARMLGGGFGEPGMRGGALPAFGEAPAPSGARKQFDAFGRRRY